MSVFLKPFAFIFEGGSVALVLVFMSLVLSYLLAYRFFWLKSLTPDTWSVGQAPASGTGDYSCWFSAVNQDCRSQLCDLDLALASHASGYKASLSRGQQGVRSIVVVAPLLGLLGTVIGMIETFDSLQDAALFSQSGGIAGGISQALITTQLGLIVAIPGLLMGRKLDRLQDQIVDHIDQVIAHQALKQSEVVL